jgi:hypothetical protein
MVRSLFALANVDEAEEWLSKAKRSAECNDFIRVGDKTTGV